MSNSAKGENNERLMVSICCITYNHEKYISKALEGFLMQKTNFEYEILIHDDASTDETAKIVREYEDKYPNIVKPIYQKENQHSKNVRISANYNFPRAKGKYIAICEGDDYWTDPLKLQKQVDYMELHPECSMCTHAAAILSCKNKITGKVRPHYINKYYSVEEVIIGGGGLFPTNSMMFRTFLVKEMPDFYLYAPIGDYPLTIFLASKGDLYYIDSCMSVYRYMAEGSWSRKMAVNSEAKIKNVLKINNMLHEIDNYTDYKYTKAINEKISQNNFAVLMHNLDVKKIKSTKYRKHYCKLSIKEKVKIHFGAYFPWVVTFWRKLRWKWIT